MNSKKLCLELLAAESEANVQEIVGSVPEMSDDRNWQPLDKRDTNFNITSNQASDGGKALTELMTNMVDAVLMKHAYQKGIDPRGKHAPRTMYKAVDSLIKNLRGGKLINLDSNDPWLRDFAQNNLVIGITGAKSKSEGFPCFTFVDNGEGQVPKEFENTFLSLSKGNKKDIDFVQGKYNMGSSGVLRYCGRHWFKLIISRRYDGKSHWGWTLMRRRPSDDHSMPVAEYFILNRKEIPSFDSDVLYPFHTMGGKRYDGVMRKTGTVVKLFDYQVGSKSLDVRRSRAILNENLVETILPFRLLDFRQSPAKNRGENRAEGVDPRPFYGMEFLLLRSHKEEGIAGEEEITNGDKISIGIVNDPELGRVSISAIQLKKDLPGWLKPNNSNNRVFHAVNGQVQYKQSRGYIAQRCGFPALKDRIVVIVDASNLSFRAHNDVWKGDREHISRTIVGEKYLDKVTTVIKESTALKELQKTIAQQELDSASKVESNELLQKLIASDRTFADLLLRREPTISLPASDRKDPSSGSDRGKWNGGKYSPTFVRLEERRRDKIEIPINSTRPVSARTDAENGYLDRTDNPGRVIIDNKVQAKFEFRAQLYNGRLVLYFGPLEEAVSVGDSFTIKIGLKDEAMPEAVESESLVLYITDEQITQKKKERPKLPDRKKNSGPGKDDTGEGKDAPILGSPKYILLTKDGRAIKGHDAVKTWPDDCNEHDGGFIEDLGDEGVIYQINYDNAYHLKYRLQQKGDIARQVVTDKYILGMRILMLGYEHAFRELQQVSDDDGNGFAEYLDTFRRMAARGAASTVLALAENLPKIIDQSSVREDVE